MKKRSPINNGWNVHVELEEYKHGHLCLLVLKRVRYVTADDFNAHNRDGSFTQSCDMGDVTSVNVNFCNF